MAGSTWSTAKLRSYREVDGRVERQCKRCLGWFPLERLAKQACCRFGRKLICKPCHNVYTETNRMRREEERVLQNQKRRIADGLLRLRKAVTRAERERKAG